MSFVLNPKTNRMIKVGGKPWRSLVKEGIIANDPIAPGKPLFVGSTIEEAKKKKAEMMEDVVNKRSTELKKPDTRILRPNHFPARRGRKIVEVAKTPRQEEIAEYTAQCASRTLHKHIDSLSDTLEDAYDQCDGSDGIDDACLKEFENNLKNLILEEMLSGEATKAPTRNLNKSMQARTKKNYIEPETEYELESDFSATDISDAEDQFDEDVIS